MLTLVSELIEGDEFLEEFIAMLTSTVSAW